MAPLAALKCIKKPPPPIPEDCGSTTFKANCAAMAASTAVPPARKIANPALAAWGLAAAIICLEAVAALRAKGLSALSEPDFDGVGPSGWPRVPIASTLDSSAWIGLAGFDRSWNCAF